MSTPRLWLICEEHVPGWLPAALSDTEMRKKAQERPAGHALYPVTANGTAIISVLGPMQKGRDIWMDLFGGTSSEDAREAVVLATADPDVDAIFLRIDSPGGEVAGVEELGDAVYRARKVKPVAAHGEDMMASAALWVGAQADTVTANKTAAVGSVGTVAVLPDTSEAWAAHGITWHVVSSGEYKGLLHEAEITDKALAYVQEQVDELAGQFFSALKRGRGMTAGQVAAVSDGRVYGATRAQELGLIDAVMGRDDAFAALEKRGRANRTTRLEKARRAVGRRQARLGAALKRARRRL